MRSQVSQGRLDTLPVFGGGENIYITLQQIYFRKQHTKFYQNLRVLQKILQQIFWSLFLTHCTLKSTSSKLSNNVNIETDKTILLLLDDYAYNFNRSKTEVHGQWYYTQLVDIVIHLKRWSLQSLATSTHGHSPIGNGQSEFIYACSYRLTETLTLTLTG